MVKPHDTTGTAMRAAHVMATDGDDVHASVVVVV
jgi:hypothetical protein